MSTAAYPSDLTDAQWDLIEPLLAGRTGPGASVELNLRRVLDAIFYLTRTGCQWRYLPHDFPNYNSVRYWYDKWSKDGTLARVHDALREQVRAKERPRQRTTASVDSQSTDSHGAHAARGFDGGKWVEGRQRHLVVDSLGLLLAVAVTAGNVTDAQGGSAGLGQLDAHDYPQLKTVFADRAYEREGFPQRVRQWQPGCRVRVVSRAADDEGFVKLPIRWVVERTNAWMTKYRRLCRSYEHTVGSEVAVIRISMIHRMVRRLSPGPPQSPFRFPRMVKC
jgi:putative transposase